MLSLFPSMIKIKICYLWMLLSLLKVIQTLFDRTMKFANSYYSCHSPDIEAIETWSETSPLLAVDEREGAFILVDSKD